MRIVRLVRTFFQKLFKAGEVLHLSSSEPEPLGKGKFGIYPQGSIIR